MDIQCRDNTPMVHTPTTIRNKRTIMSTRQKDFALNLDKAIAKKLEATRRNVEILYEFTGGGVVGNMDAITFELVKNALFHYYETTNPESYKVNIIEDKDINELIVNRIFRVFANNVHQYTLTLYLPKCKFLVNGKNVQTFINIDVPKIHTIISSVTLNGHKVDLKNMNDRLCEQLTKIQQSAGASVNNSCNLPTNDEKISAIDESKTDTVRICQTNLPLGDINGPSLCRKCNRNVLTRGVYCTQGHHWIHYRCDKLSKEEIMSKGKTPMTNMSANLTVEKHLY